MVQKDVPGMSAVMRSERLDEESDEEINFELAISALQLVLLTLAHMGQNCYVIDKKTSDDCWQRRKRDSTPLSNQSHSDRAQSCLSQQKKNKPIITGISG